MDDVLDEAVGRTLQRHLVPLHHADLAVIILAELLRRFQSLGVEVIRWPELPTSVELNAPAHYTTLWLVNFL